MIGYLLFFMILGSFAYSMWAGTSAEVSAAVISSGADAVSLVLTLAGSMAVWGGVMKIAERSGLTEALTRVMQPLLRLIFRGLKKESEALHSIAMNLSANLMGLGNAATPLGIEAMRALEREENPRDAATPNMIKLAVMNACSAEVIPATVAALRAEAGSRAPMEILPCVLLVSFASLAAALAAAELFDLWRKE